MDNASESTWASLPSPARRDIEPIVDACAAIQIGLLAVAPTGCPILMVANPAQKWRIRELSSAPTDNSHQVGQIAWDQDSGGFIVRAFGQVILSFDIPPRILELALEQHGWLEPGGQPENLKIEVLFMDTDNRTSDQNAPQRSATLIPFSLPWAELNRFRNDHQQPH